MKLNADVNTLKVIHKKEAKVTDPVRYPDVINGYEGEFKQDYVKMLQAMTKNIGEEMIKNIN